MKKVTFLFINFFLLFFILVPNTFSGPIMCNGELTNKTAKATGHLLVAFGFAYTAIGFQEAEEPNKIMFLRDTITPLTSARTAEKYFNTFLTEKLPLKLQSLDSLAKKTNYKNFYENKILPKGYFVPDRIWIEVSSRGKKDGLKGLIYV